MRKSVLLLFVCITTWNSSLCKNKDIIWMKGGSAQEFSQVYFSANGKYILSSAPYDIKIWSVENGTLLKAISYGTSPMVRPSFISSNDGRFLFYTDTNMIHCLDIEKDSIIYTLKGQKGYIESIDLSSDGNFLISASSDSTCVLWNLQEKVTPKKEFKMKGTPYWVSLSYDARSFLVTDYKNSYVFSTETGKIISTINSYHIRKSLQSDLLAISFGDRSGYIGTREIRIYKSNGQHIRNFLFKESDEIVREFCLSPSGKLLAMRNDNSVKFYDSHSGVLLREIQGELEGPVSVSPDDRFVAIGMRYVDDDIRRQGSSYILTIGIWNIQNGEQLGMIQAHQSGHLPPIFSDDSHLIVTAENSHELKMWELPVGRLIHNFTEYRSYITRIVSSPSNEIAASLTESGCMYVWNQTTGKTLWSITSYDQKVTDFRFSIDGKYIATTTLHESEIEKEGERPDYVVDTLKVFLWDAKFGMKAMQYDIPRAGWGCAILSSDGTKLFISGGDKIETWDVNRKTPIKNPNIDSFSGYGNFSPQLNYIYSAGAPTGSIQVWDTRSGKLAFKIQAHNDYVRTLSWPQDEKLLVTSGQSDGMIKVWNIPDGKILKTLKMNITEVQNGSISPNGKYFAGGNRSGIVEIWDLENGNIVRTYNEYKNVVTSIAWSTDGKFVYSGFLDGTLIAWKTNW